MILVHVHVHDVSIYILDLHATCRPSMQLVLITDHDDEMIFEFEYISE